MDMYSPAGRIEILIFQLAESAAVYRKGYIRAKGIYVKAIRALPHLFIRGKPDADLSVQDLLVRQQILCGCHDLRHAGLVISP